MRPEPWTQLPAIRRLDGPVRTRLGVSPHHSSFQVGALRTHLLTAALAHATADAVNATAEVLLRWDDTDTARVASQNETALRQELTEIADIPLSLGQQAAPIRQSGRLLAYQRGLDRLGRLGLTRPAEQGGVLLNLPAVDAFLSLSGIDPDQRTQTRLVNARRAPAPQHSTLRLTRSDGTVLWHLATVIDDIDTGVNLIVRGTDKIDGTSIQERLRALLEPDHQVAYVFLPRLTTATGAPKTRVRDVLSDAVSPEALRWFLAENYILGEEPATTFDQIVQRLRAILPKPRDSQFDLRRLVALNRKTKAASNAGIREPVQPVQVSRPAGLPS